MSVWRTGELALSQRTAAQNSRSAATGKELRFGTTRASSSRTRMANALL